MKANFTRSLCKLLLAASLLSLALASPLQPTADTPTRASPTSEQPTREVPSREPPTKEDPDVTVDYTKGNGTVEELLKELLQGNIPDQEEQGARHARALGCKKTPYYGSSTEGSAFVDFYSVSPWPCGVDITQILIRHGARIDAIQVIYRSYDGTIIGRGRHGGSTGGLSTITLGDGEHIVAVAGVINTRYVYQLTFVSRTASGETRIHGPYGHTSGATSSFLVFGKINSIFGRSGSYLNTIGFYYEADGAHNP